MYPQQYPHPAQRPPPTKYAGLGCLAWVGVVALICVLGMFAMCGVAIINAPRDAQRAAEQADAAAQQAKADAIENAKEDAKERKRCHVADGGEIFRARFDQIRDRCEDIIREGLKVPGSGSFPTESEDGNQWVTSDGCSKTLKTYVDAKNAFGVKVRTHYDCTFDPRTGIARALPTD